ncbi:MAG: aldo/keto reductase [Lachnospiraceae bacterium]|nr:aldo/keto reductase [Lachnospiraceae bacterium]
METIKLSNGVKMPIMVSATNWMNYRQLKPVMEEAFHSGFRAIDTARDYGNEAVVGHVLENVLKETGLSRNDVFVTTKIGNSQQIMGDIEHEIELSLNNLRTDYIDLWLMHWPYPGYYVDTWHKMEEVYRSGKVRAIGMANCNVRYLKELYAAGVRENIHCVQFECHPMRTALDILSFCHEKNIAIQAYSPLCRMIEPIKASSVLKNIATEHGKTIAQIILRWHLQNRTVPVIKTTKPERLAVKI